jgi:isoquinoline 1-oxidoreductase alpha subunit
MVDQMSEIILVVNGEKFDLDVPPEMPLLWVLRDVLGLTGTKYGCGIGLCGTCTVLVDGKAIRSCLLPVTSVTEREITTIEGLSPDGSHPLQQAWVEEGVSECGYCQPGQILTALDLLSRNPNPSDEEIDDAMSGVLCRCGSYNRIRRAIHRATQAEAGS